MMNFLANSMSEACGLLVLRLVSSVEAGQVFFSIKEGAGPFGIDTSIEGLNSQEFSVGIFYFLIASIIVFTIFVFMFMFKGKSSGLKTGEKVMFVFILLGIVVAVGAGAAQMLHGYLF
ncbi:MAG: hypothetical protein GXP17_03365 [Gammaproteobacteria bacterium]|nr:hypothetical protein [Gammaproteobacteria bacterium]